MTAAALLAMLLLVAGLAAQHQFEESRFYAGLPADARADLDDDLAGGGGRNAEVREIYARYWPDDGPGELTAIVAILLASLSLGGLAAWQAARTFGRPLASVTEAALRISRGDLTVRAEAGKGSGELVKLLHNFNQMAASLERLEAERRETIAAISHELRTPLTILQGRLHALCDGVIPGSASEHRKLLEQAEHLVRLVEDLNTLSLVSARQLPLACVEIDLGAFVQGLLPVFVHRLASHGVRLDCETRPALVMADRDRLRQVVTNLVENALHYAAGGGVLEFRVRAEAPWAVLEINDRGPGLPEEVTDRVFDPFFRVDNSRSRATGGTGLGLSVVQMLVHQHNGEVRAFNREGGGASFRISLPLVVR